MIVLLLSLTAHAGSSMSSYSWMYALTERGAEARAVKRLQAKAAAKGLKVDVYEAKSTCTHALLLLMLPNCSATARGAIVASQ